MNFITNAISACSEYKQAVSAFRANAAPLQLAGLSVVHKANIIAAFCGEFDDIQCAVICADETAAKKLKGDIEAFYPDSCVLLPERDFILTSGSFSSHEWEHRRIAALNEFLSGNKKIIIASVQAAVQRTIPIDVLRKAVFRVSNNDKISPERLIFMLIASGYCRCLSTECVGQFSVRGGIIDVFPIASENPVRIEFFDDEIDTISYFDPLSQRRGEELKQVEFIPAREILVSERLENVISRLEDESKKAEGKKLEKLAAALNSDIENLRESGEPTDRIMPYVYKENACLLDYLGDCAVFIDDIPRVAEAADAYALRINQDLRTLIEEQKISGSYADFYTKFSDFLRGINQTNLILLDAFVAGKSIVAPKSIINFNARLLASYNGSLESAVSEISEFIQNNYTVCVMCGGESRCEGMCRMLKDAGIKFTYGGALQAGVVTVMNGAISSGFEYPDIKLAVISDGQIASSASHTKRKKHSKFDSNQRIKSYSDLEVGDIIVHETHGIGRFAGIERLKLDGIEKDYIRIAFRGTDTLFIPATSLGVISKYIGSGGEETTVRLSKLGGIEWKNQKSRAKAAAQDMAKKLIALYAERQRRPGFAFEKDSDAQNLFEQSFQYTETDDQLRCIEEIKADMERPVPMDRLLCGDVGFGKTEVAFRAVMKCILSGKQAALLAPTTVLARQHYITALARFKDIGAEIRLLSRFTTSAEEKKTLAGLKSGRIDFVIGTHKLLRKGLKFHDLGLLIVDEEQRFGVSHKETIKQMSTYIDVLTLSATPIPRTLGMALAGIRDMSLIEEPPSGRQPVSTQVMEFDGRIIYDAIRRELARGGQVYYLHNRTESIEKTAALLAEKFPDAVVETAYGSMSEEMLSGVMQRLVDGEINILVCTTIIETGIDVPNVNTLIIEDAQNFGLSQLHQLRGRIGRSSRRAYAYITFRKDRALTEIAQKRLSAIRQFAEFGSGFKIAIRDLEIRGAGNILGAEQSGHLQAVGYDMYVKMLENAVLTEQGKTPAKEAADCSVDINLSANIPESFVPVPGERIDLYRRIARIRDREDYSDILDEIIDRFGEPPKSVMALLDISALRAIAASCGISDITQKGNTVGIKFADFDVESFSRLCTDSAYSGRLQLNPKNAIPEIILRLKKDDEILSILNGFIKDYSAAGKELQTV